MFHCYCCDEEGGCSFRVTKASKGNPSLIFRSSKVDWTERYVIRCNGDALLLDEDDDDEDDDEDDDDDAL